MKDVRFGLRVLWKSKGFTAVAVLTLGLGIGVNAAIFSGVSAFVLRPLGGVGEPEGVHSVFETSAVEGGHGYNDFSYPDLLDYRARTDVFDGLLAHTMTQAAVGRSDNADVVWGELVTGNFFDVLKVKMQRGRGFLPEEDATPGTHPVVVLSDDLWRKRFDAAPDIVGRQVQLNGRPLTVVGVAPPEFAGAKWALSMKFWVPLMSKQYVGGGTNDWMTQRGNHWLDVLGRLKPGATREQAAAALTSVAAQLEREYPAARNKDVRVLVLPEREGRWDDMGGVVRLSSGLALALVGLVLLIACANVANLLIARAFMRQKELAVRLSLGASRGRLVRQLLVESLVLSCGGGLLGVALAVLMTRGLLALIPSGGQPLLVSPRPDARILAFTCALTFLTGVVFGLLPALRASRPDP
ncbi:MAG TPA: ABC transporter permease, partial [Pyrinomonadaceae bacterium]